MSRRARRPTAARRRWPVELLGLDRLSVFVPAVMSIGLVFWVLSELRELLSDSRDDALQKRASLGARSVTRSVVAGGAPTAATDRNGLRHRAVYAAIGIGLLAAAAYLTVGLYLRQTQDLRGAGPGVSGEAWLLGVAACLACAATVYGAAALAIASRRRHPPAWSLGVAARSPLSTRPVALDDYPGHGSRAVSVGFAVSATAAVILAVVVGWARPLLQGFDDRLLSYLHRNDPLDLFETFEVLDPLGKTEVALAFALFAGLAALRCRVLAAAYGAATVFGLMAGVATRAVVARPRPPGVLGGGFDSFPSGHVAMAVLFAGAMPLAVAVLVNRRWLIQPLRVVFGLAAAASAVHRVSASVHWPTDVIGGALWGLALAFAVQWAVDTERSHRLCRGCLWSHNHPGHLRGALPLHPRAQPVIRIVAHLSAAAAAIGLAALTFTRGLPSNSEGFVFAESTQRPVQLALAGLVSIGALVAWRREAFGAALIAVAAAGLGLFAAVQYPPVVGLGVTLALLVPAVLLWLSWQHRRLPHEIMILAVVTALLVAGTWAGAVAVYEANFGPSHPQSAAPAFEADRVEWVWLGGLSPTELTVTTRLVAGGREARLSLENHDRGVVLTSEPARPGRHRIARLVVDGLEPAASYDYTIEVDGQPDRSRGRGTFRTPAEGPESFVMAVASCARVGSNGAVYDAIRDADPLVYLELGDIHYGDIETTSTLPYLEAFDRLLATPGQSALYRDVPMAYVWDDHDYGPNDADAASPGRRAAREAYRIAVPHYPVPPGDAPIYQAFTLGRVRVIVTDGRSERTATTMLGETQVEWLIDELRASSATHALVVWANSVPWIGEASPGADTWAGYPEERRRIADAVAEAGIENLVMVSGDAHMVAIDDGTNSDFSTAGAGGFPVLHAAALDRPGTVKGGPYSEGTFPGGGQFGTVEVVDEGGETVEVRLAGRDWRGREIVSLDVTVAVPSGAR